MPEKVTIEKAQQDLREGKRPTTAAGEFVREEIHHVREGKHGARSTEQAIAIGLSKARKAGVKLGPAPRSRTTHKDKRPASHKALASHAKATARRRGAAARSASARKAARTRARHAHA